MKQKLSITVDEKMIILIEELLKNCAYRNKSHVVEMALQKFLEEKNDKLN